MARKGGVGLFNYVNENCAFLVRENNYCQCQGSPAALHAPSPCYVTPGGGDGVGEDDGGGTVWNGPSFVLVRGQMS